METGSLQSTAAYFNIVTLMPILPLTGFVYLDKLLNFFVL